MGTRPCREETVSLNNLQLGAPAISLPPPLPFTLQNHPSVTCQDKDWVCMHTVSLNVCPKSCQTYYISAKPEHCFLAQTDFGSHNYEFEVALRVSINFGNNMFFRIMCGVCPTPNHQPDCVQINGVPWYRYYTHALGYLLSVNIQ